MPASTPEFARSAFEQLLAQNPAFHGEGDTRHQWSLSHEVLRWLFDAVRDGQRTLETGCGFSTVVFALKGAQHTVVSPLAEEHRRIREWGEARGIDFSRVIFIARKSEEVLPGLAEDALDVVLIDGWHAFPAPFIDWFYACRRLARGGLLIVDDTQIRACRILRDFLEEEAGRWHLERRFERTDVFRKVDDEMFAGDWRSQPYNAQPILGLGARWATSLRPRLVAVVAAIPGLSGLLKAARALVFRKRA
jgi:predicted O-methyltransferase YrrM